MRRATSYTAPLMDFDLSTEQEQIRKLARDFAEREIAPGARDRDRGETFPRDVLAKMAPLGLLGAPIPEEYGGMGVDYVSHALITEEIGRADSSVRTTLSVQISLVELTILRYGSEEQKRRYLPALCRGELIGCFGLTEPEVGSDATKLRATARRDGDGWILNGRKTWISNGSVSGLALVSRRRIRRRATAGSPHSSSSATSSLTGVSPSTASSACARPTRAS